jgi:Trk K+ transport system NAD-binding subunit
VASFKYGEASLSLQRGALVGIDRNGDVLLNPRADEVIIEDDLLIVLAEDENKIAFGDKKGFNEKAIKIHSHEPASKELTLILGSNSSLPLILREIDNFAAKGSKVMLVDELASSFMSELKNIRLETQDKNPSSRKVLNELKVQTFDHIIVLADRDRKSTEQADARTLLTLLNLRAINASNPRELNIVTEMLNDKNRELAESSNADDFIISDKLVSNMITMVSENTEMSHVLQAVLASEGAQVRLHPASWYVKTGVEVDFYTITEAATRRGDSAIGYRLAKDGQEIYLNPNRDELVSFGEQDRIVVLTAD